MSTQPKKKVNRRTFLKRAALTTAVGAAGAAGVSYWLGGKTRLSRSSGKKVLVIGIDGMDPRLCQRMMAEGLLPNLARLHFRPLATSCPPQSPVAWANFINGAGPGSHGIFDFVHRHPEEQYAPFFSGAETLPGEGHLELGDSRVQLDFWPFHHRPPTTVCRRQGTPFWDYLDAAGVPSTFYDLPSNYPPTPSAHGHHRCLSGLGTPDMLGTYGKYQYFSEDGPAQAVDGDDHRRCRLTFENETARAVLLGPEDSFRRQPRPTEVEFFVHRDRQADAVVLDLQGQRLVLRAGDWSRWVKLSLVRPPWFTLAGSVSGLVRFFVQQVRPPCRLYVSPINIDPAAPATRISEPSSFVQEIAAQRGPFSTLGFQEAYQARKNNDFNDDEFIRQAGMVLEERLALLDYALENYDDGLLFFYFSSSDLQSHILWWDSDAPHPVRHEPGQARRCFEQVRQLYRRLDRVIGELVQRYGSQATFFVMSDHGFANFGRQFNLNTWLREEDYLGPADCTSLLHDVDWSQTKAYGLGINGLYLNLKGRERDGIVEPHERAALLEELKTRLEALTDVNGARIIRGVYRADQVYHGEAVALAPDLIIGYARGYRASWDTCLGALSREYLLDNNLAWSADHCADALEVPGVLFCNRDIRATNPSLVDMAPTILEEFGLETPATMEGRNVFRRGD
jgi:predicted AlkP superfamily phosphohydrolase/phosphomutase